MQLWWRPMILEAYPLLDTYHEKCRWYGRHLGIALGANDMWWSSRRGKAEQFLTCWWRPRLRRLEKGKSQPYRKGIHMVRIRWKKLCNRREERCWLQLRIVFGFSYHLCMCCTASSCPSFRMCNQYSLIICQREPKIKLTFALIRRSWRFQITLQTFGTFRVVLIRTSYSGKAARDRSASFLCKHLCILGYTYRHKSSCPWGNIQLRKKNT